MLFLTSESSIAFAILHLATFGCIYFNYASRRLLKTATFIENIFVPGTFVNRLIVLELVASLFLVTMTSPKQFFLVVLVKIYFYRQ